MAKNFCCIVWKSLHKELAKLKHDQLQKFIDQGVPESTFAPVIEVLDSMGDNCPVCRTSASGQPVTPAVIVPSAPAAPPPAPLKRRCKACNGAGTSDGKPRTSEDDTNCMNCHGTGEINNNTRKEYKVSPEAQAKINARENEIRNAQKGKVIDVTLPPDDDPDA